MQIRGHKFFFFVIVINFIFPTLLEAASAKFHVDVGLNHFYKKRFLEAYREFKAALEKDPKYAEAHYNLGRVYKAQGFFKEALIEFQIAIKLNPGYLAARRELDMIKSSLEQDVRTQLKIQGQETVNQTDFSSIPSDEAEKKGRQLLQQGKSEEAIRYFEQALRQKPNDVA
ncbi:MAG: tetratricopeptide repeat protein, partial [Candidatus Riflebacteria bacterium]